MKSEISIITCSSVFAYTLLPNDNLKQETPPPIRLTSACLFQLSPPQTKKQKQREERKINGNRIVNGTV